MNVPLVQAFDLQVAWRNEAYSDFEGEDVSRYAFVGELQMESYLEDPHKKPLELLTSTL